ncbi:MAG: c-type cytochrome [Rhodopirellula sp.]|nr:c-type cytochrome [Rhodopirellula sp.]
MLRLFLLVAVLVGSRVGMSADGNSLQYLQENNPWYPHTGFPKLTTPQWVGEEDVEAVVVLAIDDMRDTAKYEAYLRPILQRLKQIDGRAPVSIMTCNVKPDDPQLQTWLDEGLSIEVHTVDHPCPILQGGDLAKAKSTYDRCVDLLGQIPRNKPVAFRTPCCDSLNTVSPRFFSEIFNRTTEQGNYLSLSSSVFSMYTSADPDIPKELLTDADGREKFRKYLPKGLKRNGVAQDNFVNWIENYPYPYVINNLCWEFPCMVPSDWEAQFLQQPNNPKTVEDMKTALDITVLKQGVFNLVFHPHGWIKAEQVVELIDHAVEKHGKKVKFLNFREAHDRLNENLLAGQPLRKTDGSDNGVRLLDLNRDGFMDVVIGTAAHRLTRLWSPRSRTWHETSFPVRIGKGSHLTRVREDGTISILSETLEGPDLNKESVTERAREHAWYFDGREWLNDDYLQHLITFSQTVREMPIEREDKPVAVVRPPETRTWRFRDIDHDGRCEVIVTWRAVANDGSLSSPAKTDVQLFQPVTPVAQVRVGSPEKRPAGSPTWRQMRFAWPDGSDVPAAGIDPELYRFVDLDGNGSDDLIASTSRGTTVALFEDLEQGWTRTLLNAERTSTKSLPMIILEDGSDNGFFFQSGHLCWQNEFTADLPDMIHRVSIEKLLRLLRIEQGAVSPLKKPDTDATADASADSFPLSKTPEESLATIQVAPGLKVELVAAEPLIQDPVAFEWDVQGRLWVVQMGGYPNGATDETGKPISGGEIRVLEDVDHDGKYDKATTFLDGLNFPTGIHRWRNGVIVTDAPTIFYAEDTDGDLKADVRKTLYDGFVEGNQQHRVNGLRYGLDNWLYVANGDSGGTIESVSYLKEGWRGESNSEMSSCEDTTFSDFLSSQTQVSGPGCQISIRGRDLRIQPDYGLMDPVSGQSQFGRCRDDWGNWFGGNNSRPMWHNTLEDKYTRRNPHFSSGDPRREIFEPPGASPVFPISQTLERFNDHDRANRFTSACSVMIYRDWLLGEEFAGDAFVCEPVHNLVSRRVVTRTGTTFSAKRSANETDREFLASSDNWFRPVMTRTGPDGAIWIADMYRFVIEHPEWIPEDWQQKLNLQAGNGMGRIYRIVREANPACCGATVDSAKPPSSDTERSWLTTAWDNASRETLRGRLASPNGWWRDAAQRAILQRNDHDFDDSLHEMATTHPSPLARLHALSLATPQLIGGSELLIPALHDTHPEIRRHAIRTAEPWLQPSASKHHQEVTRAVLAMANDDDPRVILQLAYSLGSLIGKERIEDAQSGQVLAKLVVQYQNHPQIFAAAMSSLTENNMDAVFAEAIRLEDRADSALVLQLVGQAAAFGRLDSLVTCFEKAVGDDDVAVDVASLNRVAALIREIRRDETAWKNLTTMPVWQEKIAPKITNRVARAESILNEPDADTTSQISAIQFLATVGAGQASASERLASMISPKNSPTLQSAILSALTTIADRQTPDRLLSHWRTLTPTSRTEVTEALLNRAEWIPALLTALENGTVTDRDLNAAQRERLLRSRSGNIKDRATKLFAVPGASARHEIVKQFESEVSSPGNAAKGRLVFEKRCSACHRLQGVGKSVGADLTALRDRSTRALLTAILDPNRAVEAKFLTYTVAMNSGQVFSGMLASESGNSITLIATDGKEHVLLRKEIDELASSGRSLMPEGLEKDLSKQDIADVIAFVQTSGLQPKELAFNSPAQISPNDDGSIVLPASAAAVFGPNLIVEEHFRNLGNWLSENDHAAWTVNLPGGGSEKTFDVEFDFACHRSAAGNQLVLTVAGQTVEGRVPSTDRWDRYSTWKVGTITLSPGASRLVVLTRSPPVQALIDLRKIRLIPRAE